MKRLLILSNIIEWHYNFGALCFRNTTRGTMWDVSTRICNGSKWVYQLHRSLERNHSHLSSCSLWWLSHHMGQLSSCYQYLRCSRPTSLVIFTEHILDTCMRNVDIIKKITNKIKQKNIKLHWEVWVLILIFNLVRMRRVWRYQSTLSAIFVRVFSETVSSWGLWPDKSLTHLWNKAITSCWEEGEPWKYQDLNWGQRSLETVSGEIYFGLVPCNYGSTLLPPHHKVSFFTMPSLPC